MVTLKEIARECNVSATTVSNILNGKPKVSEETRLKVLDVVKRRGYQPNYIAQGLRNRKTKMIGIIAEDISQFSTPGMIESIMSCCEEKGYRTIVQNLRLYARWQESWFNNEEAYRSVLEPALQELRSIKVDGLIYVAGHARIIHPFKEELKMPAVMAYAYTDSPRVPSVVIEDEKGGYDMVKYLLSMGHKRIGIIGGRPDNIHTKKRLLGAQKALFEAGVPYNPDWVRYGAWNRESGYGQAGAIVDAGVSAIFCMSDLMAGGVYDYLEEHGLKAGEDISVAGFDNQDVAEYFRPALTTMCLPLSEIGRKSAEMLLECIDGDAETQEASENRPVEIAVPCSLVVRSSVKKKL
nr:LacI family DNA-binding transcriptional regulator [uncultured Eisenbergiella sp.]